VMKWFLLPSYDRLNVGEFIAFGGEENLLPEHPSNAYNRTVLA
jgi:hypothetical protein